MGHRDGRKAKPATAIKLNVNSLLAQEGTALGLPIKVKLSNALLGNNCYLGSNSNPIQINFTTPRIERASGPGSNSAVLEGMLESASAAAVKASE